MQKPLWTYLSTGADDNSLLMCKAGYIDLNGANSAEMWCFWPKSGGNVVFLAYFGVFLERLYIEPLHTYVSYIKLPQSFEKLSTTLSTGVSYFIHKLSTGAT